MVSTLSTGLALLSTLRWASAASVAERQATGASGCRDVHIFLGRGNNEPYPGRQGKLVTAICDGIDSCDYEDIQFYNPTEAPFCESVEEGAANGIEQITAYNKRCPDAKLVLSGYSQGGHVVGDVLGGGGGSLSWPLGDCEQKSNAGLDATKAPANKIAAVLLFGDTRHTANQSYNSLSGAGADGWFPRPEDQLAGIGAFANVTRSFCDEGDPVCAGGDIPDRHLDYFDVYCGDAAEWVHEILGLADTTTSSTGTSASSTRPASSSTSAIPSASATTASASSPSASPTTGLSTQASPTSDNAASSPSPTSENAAMALGSNSVLLGTACLMSLIAFGMM